MQRRLHSRSIPYSLLACLLSSCAVGPDYHAPELQVPNSFVNADKQNEQEALSVNASALWWKALGDATLNGLIDHAIQGNQKLEVALMHVQEAREQESVVLGDALPTINASAGGGRGTGSDMGRGRAGQALVSAQNTEGYRHVTGIYGFDAAWELDIFGKYRREMEAANYDAQAAEAARNEVLTTIISDVVRGYVDMRGLQMQQKVLAQNIKAAADYTHFVQQRYDRGITNGLDLTLAQRQLDTLKAQSAPLGAQIRAAQYTIAVLCGEFPESMIAELDKLGVIPQMPPTLATGVPLDLLHNRPDIQQAEKQLASANAQIGAAEANLFPRFSLTGSTGFQVQSLGVSPYKQNYIWSLGPGISVLLLDFGTLDAQVNVADYETHAKAATYKQTVLDAVEQVDTATSTYNAQQDRLKNLSLALTASQQAVSLANQRYDRGLTDSLNIIDAQRQQFDLEQQYVIAQQTAAEQFVVLHKALGHGWEQFQKLPPVRQPMPAVIAAFERTIE